MDAKKICRDELLKLAKEKKIYLEGNILKVLKAGDGDIEFQKYLDTCKQRDVDSRKKRLTVTKQVQKQNKELEAAARENERINKQLSKALDEASTSEKEAREAEAEAHMAKAEAEKLRDDAMEDLDTLQKRTQFELIGLIVKVALWIIASVGFVTTLLYLLVLAKGYDSKIVESTWSNLFGILLTNSFSIIGTIMGVKYATESKK
jgi:uncharacterized membrane protein YqiK